MKRSVPSLILTLALLLSLCSVSFAAEQPPARRFSDVPSTHWAYDYIEELVSRGAIDGYPDGKFYPEKTVTREEFAKIMVMAAGLVPLPAAESTYADVSLSHWSSPYIETARPYMTAYQSMGRLYFYPFSGALREDMAVAVVKLRGFDPTKADLSLLSTMFSDLSSISEVARPYVALAVEQGIINGYNDGTFRGQGTITRAEAAAILYRAFQQPAGDKVIPDDLLPSPSPEPSPEVTPEPSPEPSQEPEPSTPPEPEASLDRLVCVTAAADRVTYQNGAYSLQVELLSTDGTKSVVNINQVNGAALTWSSTGSPMVNKLFTYTQKDGLYQLWEVPTAGSWGEFEVRAVNGSLDTSLRLADDAQICVTAAINGNMQYQVCSGKEVKSWGSISANGSLIYKKVNGIFYAAAGILDLGERSEWPSEPPKGPAYGYILSTPYLVYVNGAVYSSFEVWNGTETVSVLDQSATNCSAGTPVTYLEDGTGKIEVTSVITNVGAVVGYNMADYIIAIADTNGTSRQFTLDGETVIIYFDSFRHQGVAAGNLMLASQNDDSAYIPNVFYQLSEDGETLNALFVDVNNAITGASAVPVG